MKKLLAEIKETAPSYGSIPFWSWNDKLEPEELRRATAAALGRGCPGAPSDASEGVSSASISSLARLLIRASSC